MNAIRKQWNEAQEGGFGTPTTWRMSQQIRAQKDEHESFHDLMQIIPAELRNEVIALWVRGTQASADEAYNRRLLKSELSELDFNETQNIAHEAWKKLLKISA
jgi:hypothetical protein